MLSSLEPRERLMALIAISYAWPWLSRSREWNQRINDTRKLVRGDISEIEHAARRVSARIKSELAGMMEDAG